jgi:hypothetical protein
MIRNARLRPASGQLVANTTHSQDMRRAGWFVAFLNWGKIRG